MKPKLQLAASVLLATLVAQHSTCSAATTMDGTNYFAHGANLGWMDLRGDTNSSAVFSVSHNVNSF